MAVLAQREEGLLRAVRRRGQPVRAQADPGEQGDQRDAVEERPVGKVARAADQDPLEPLEEVGGRVPGLGLGRRMAPGGHPITVPLRGRAREPLASTHGPEGNPLPSVRGRRGPHPARGWAWS